MDFMIKTWVKYIFCVVATLVAAIIMPAQDLPVLPPDKAVKTGVLPNGTEYYIVSNPTFKGVADFALVQRTGTDNISDTASYRAVNVARDALCMLPRTGGISVQEYFTSHGVTPGKEGFVKVTDDATEFRFSNVFLSKPEVLDSTLLVLLDMVDRISTTDDPFIRKWYSPKRSPARWTPLFSSQRTPDIQFARSRMSRAILSFLWARCPISARGIMSQHQANG